MSSSLTLNGRLPGVLCETALQPQAESPLRLDIAAFVGFAERGPVDTPLAVEDINQYRALFGGDLLIASQDGKPVYANLPGAVQAFFDNGGRRCYVVRVVGEGATANRFRMPGLVAWYQGTGTFEDQGAVTTVVDTAASVGSWSNTMSVGTQLRTLPVHISLDATNTDATTTWENEQTLTLELPPMTTLVPGDLLRLQFDGTGGPVVICSVALAVPVQKQATPPATTRGTTVIVKANPGTVLTFARRIVGPLPVPNMIERKTKDGWESLAFTSATLEELPSVDEGYALDLSVTRDISIGDLLRLTFADNRTLSFKVTGVEPGTGSPPPPSGENSLHLTSQQPLWNLLPNLAEKLGEKGWEPLLSPLSPLEAQLGRFGEYRLFLPINATVQVGDMLRVTCADNTVLIFPVERVDTLQSESSPPEAMLRVVSSEPLWWLHKPPSPPPAAFAMFGQLIEVDLLSFDLFIREGGLVQESWLEQRFSAGPNYWGQTLADQSTRLQAPLDALDPETSPFYLPLGMSDLPGPGEFSKALPDNTQLASPPAWLSHKDGLDTFDPVALFLDPRFKDIGVRDLINEANQYLYLDPGPYVEPLKKLHSLLEVEEIGLISLPDAIHRPWGPPEGPPGDMVIPPEPPPPDWSHFHNCPVPPPPPDGAKQLCLQPFDFNPMDDTEEIPDIKQQLALLPVLTPASFYQLDQLLGVQKALVILCAARADVVAILSLPEHFARREALDWQQALQTTLLGKTVTADDLNMLSYVAAYHPWLQIPEPVTPALAPLRAMPPDGACCGMIAARELLRGPWIAPANVPLRGAVALTPDLTKADWAALFDARINLVRQLPGQFTLMSAHTMSYDDQLVQISVRRLLIFLRKLALQRGMRYVFETNNERFRQRVQASFESTLNALVARGGIIAFEVVTDESINTPNDFDNGRFLIALKVAPTLPIEFITVILLRSGEDLLNVIER